MSRCSHHRQCLDQACSTSPLSRISSKPVAETSRKIERFCCFYSGPHKRYPSSASALFVYVRSLLHLSLYLLLAWKIYHSLPIFETHTALLFDATFLSLVISTRSRNQFINNKINKNLPPKLFPRRSSQSCHHRKRSLQHIISVSFYKSGCGRNTSSFFYVSFSKGVGSTFGHAGAGAI